MGVRARSNANLPPMLELHIEELVLHGFPVSQHRSIGDAVQKELTRLIEEQGMPSLTTRPVSLERLNAGSFKTAKQATAPVIGRQLARQIHQQLSQTSSTPSRRLSVQKRTAR